MATRVDDDYGPELPTQGVVPARAKPPGLSLTIVSESGSETRALPNTGTLIVGRGKESDVRIDHPSISRSHARLVIAGDTIAIEDLGSQNGTRVREQIATAGTPVQIRPGDLIDLGSVMIVVRKEPPDAPAAGSRAAESAMTQLDPLIARIAPSEINILIVGETGVGKEIMAERIHAASKRARKTLVRLNCGAIPENLLENELFGHEKGAFTGADQTAIGQLETGAGGTVFLDEVGELPLVVQTKLLRVLEDRKITRLGSTKARDIDVRFIFATHRDLESGVANGTFRQDLYFRMNGISLQIPPLRERKREIEPLARQFVDEASKNQGRTPPRLSADVLAQLQRHAWPGNIRELRNVMERAVLLADDVIAVEHLRQAGARSEKPEGELWAQVETLERQKIKDALAQAGGNQTHAAKLLGISRGTLITRMNTYGLRRGRDE